MRSLVQILALFTLSLPLVVSGVPTSDGDSGCPGYGSTRCPRGIDVSNREGSINWSKVKANGVKFAYIKATEGTTFVDPAFTSNYAGATDNGIIRGAYHLPTPGDSPGAAQATFFLANGGGWTGDGRTLPGAIYLDGDCSGLGTEEMGSWIRDFCDTYVEVTDRLPTIYTTKNWWASCTGNNLEFSDNALWIAWGVTIEIPAGWSYATFWQPRTSGIDDPGDPGGQDYFWGNDTDLQRFALD